MRLLLDSNIIIDHLNNIKEATEFIADNYDRIHISVITRAQVLAGCNKKNINKVKRLINQFPTLSMTSKDADQAAEIRSKYRLKLPDAIQAAIAQNNNLAIVTRNTKDFTKRIFKDLIVPYKV